MAEALDYFKYTFNRLNAKQLDLLDEIYTSDAGFRDPVHELQGLPALRDYYGRLYQGVVSYHRDYFDMGEFIYERVPVLGGILRGIKNRL